MAANPHPCVTGRSSLPLSFEGLGIEDIKFGKTSLAKATGVGKGAAQCCLIDVPATKVKGAGDAGLCRTACRVSLEPARPS